MNMKRAKGLILLLAALSVWIGSCATQEKLSSELNWNLGTEPPTIDLALATDSVSIQCDEALSLGLIDFGDTSDAAVIPELALEWGVSDDGLTWTFNMRDDVWWVHYDPATQLSEKKREVTAHDVVYGLRPMLDPETASDYAYVGNIIRNAEVVNLGESTDFASVGVNAVDDFTLESSLEQPAGYFPAVAGMWVNRPVPKEVIDEQGDLWTEPGNL